MLPNLVIIGAQKCGTTSLHLYLAGHPQVQMSRPKELHFFVEAGNWSRGLEWYERHFDAPGRAIYGEASPSYSAWPTHRGVPERLHRTVPAARLIYLVRDPIDRMVSQWTMRTRNGVESRPLDAALRHVDGADYLFRSRYHLQLGLYLEHFPPEQILVVDSDDLDRDRAATLRRVHRFLGIDEGHRGSRHRLRYHRTADRRKLGPGFLPDRARDLLGRAAGRAGFRPPRPAVSPALRAWLVDQLRDDVRQLRETTGQRFGGWSL
ncbi:MAG TPA: sulfotransferase [Solirubrobacteraceae bacterium]|jgi:hypothetical protein